MADTTRVTNARAYVKTQADSEQVAVSAVRAYVKTQVDSVAVRATQVMAYVKAVRVWPSQVTQVGAYIELNGVRVRATQMGVYVELGKPRRPKARYEYDGVDLTNYCNALDLEIAPRELRKGRLSDVAQMYQIGLADNVVRLGGDWNPTIDAILGRDAFTKNWRTSRVEYEDGVRRIRYSWTVRAQVTEWRVVTAATGKIEFHATIRHNGLGVRTVNVT